LQPLLNPSFSVSLFQILPSTEIVTTCQGMNFPLLWSALFTAFFDAAAAGDLHARHGDAPDVVFPDDGREFFG
jgi:hypothetical protein